MSTTIAYGLGSDMLVQGAGTGKITAAETRAALARAVRLAAHERQERPACTCHPPFRRPWPAVVIADGGVCCAGCGGARPEVRSWADTCQAAEDRLRGQR